MWLNPLLYEVEYLPPSLEDLSADKNQVINFDFSPLSNLRKCHIYSKEGYISRKSMKNLCSTARFVCRGADGEDNSS